MAIGAKERWRRHEYAFRFSTFTRLGQRTLGTRSLTLLCFERAVVR